MRFVSVLRQSGLALVLASLGASLAPATAQTSGSAAAQGKVPGPAKAPVKYAKKRHAKSAPVPASMLETRPPDPPPPDWPANDKAKLATIEWNGRELSIAASNSSLKQILHDVSTATGLKVEGISNDQRADARVYGSYGPASTQDVLSQLLEGSGYNVLMIGDEGAGTPRELLLTAKSAHGKSAPGGGGASRQFQPQTQDDESVEEPEAPEQPTPPQLPQNPADQGRTPQQQIQELQQQRLQQLQQQQQQQQSGQPPAYNPNPVQNPQPPPN